MYRANKQRKKCRIVPIKAIEIYGVLLVIIQGQLEAYCSLK